MTKIASPQKSLPIKRESLSKTGCALFFAPAPCRDGADLDWWSIASIMPRRTMCRSPWASRPISSLLSSATSIALGIRALPPTSRPNYSGLSARLSTRRLPKACPRPAAFLRPPPTPTMIFFMPCATRLISSLPSRSIVCSATWARSSPIQTAF